MIAGALERPRTLILLGLATVCWAFSFGVDAPLASLWLQEAGRGQTVIGLNAAVYFLGIAAAAGLVPALMRRWGRGCIVGGMVASGLTVAAFPWAGGLVGLFLLRALNGGASALSLIPLETWLGQQSRPEQRARNFGFYVFCLGLGMALGTLAGLHLYPLLPRLTFALGGIVAGLAGLIFLFWLPATPVAEEELNNGPLDVGRNLLGFGSAWNQGFLEAGLMALIPIYLLGVGFTEASASWLMSGVILGAIAAQVPLGWLADRAGRTRVLLGCYALALVGLACLPFCDSAATLALWMWLVASCAGSFYPLGLAVLSENVPANGMARANACVLAVNCLGSVVGPAVTGGAMDLLGRPALFGAGAATVAGSLLVWVIGRQVRRRGKAHTLSASDPASGVNVPSTPIQAA
jgi:MFS family permease